MPQDILAQEIAKLGGVTAVARMLDVDRNTVRNWITHQNIPLHRLQALARRGLDMAALIPPLDLDLLDHTGD